MPAAIFKPHRDVTLTMLQEGYRNFFFAVCQKEYISWALQHKSDRPIAG